MQHYTDTTLAENRRYLEALSLPYPTARSAAAEIINLRAILDLPKGTEHFLSDIHGEHEAFRHILNNASGTVREKVDILLGNTLSSQERAELATLIYYPEAKLKAAHERLPHTAEREEWYRLTLLRLLSVCRLVSSKYTRSKVRKAFPKEYAYILEELLTGQESGLNRAAYYENILTSVIDLGQADRFIAALAATIKRLSVDRLHIVGDIFDRGARPDIVMDDLMAYHRVDIQWGNHDILWMGAASGSRTCIANALNNAFSYGNLDTIEVGYGISLRPLALFAAEVYGPSHDVRCFWPKGPKSTPSYAANAPHLVARMHKAIAVILFKLEGHIIRLNPSFRMEDRLLLDKIDYSAGTITLDGKTYALRDHDFPTIDPQDPYRLTTEEEQVMEQLKTAFRRSEKLQRHVDFLFSHGSLYKCCNQNLLFHGCIPMNEDGSLAELEVEGRPLSGKALLDALERITRRGYYAPWDSDEQRIGKNYMWFLWGGRHSPLFGRARMCTFERLLLRETETHEEPRNPYYNLYHDEQACLRLLREFGLSSPHSHIINGHIPVCQIEGESPIKAGGRLVVIDGGFCRAYQKRTGTAGYTLVYNSYGMRIIAHEPFVGITHAIENNQDILSTTVVFDVMEQRIRVAETDDGEQIREQIRGLTMLLYAYQSGFLKERG